MKSLRRFLTETLEEDIGQEDITTNRIVPADLRCRARLVAKESGVLSGIEAFRMTFEIMKAKISDWDSLRDGDRFSKGDDIATFKGNTRGVLTGERTAMNLVQHLTGVATMTSKFVSAVQGLKVKVSDTRKTTPLMRRLEKEAVTHGGGTNHRHSLFNGVLIKENHIAAAGGIAEAVRRANSGAHHLMKIEVEVTNLQEFEEALEAGADAIMLDNMTTDDMRKAVERAKGQKVLLEASGNASLDNIRALAETGVDIISVGALTHSAPAVDLSLLIEGL